MNTRRRVRLGWWWCYPTLF